MSKLLLVISCLIASGIAAQGENNNWFFGYQAGLDFSTVPPTPATGQLSTLEGCATVSDASGNLLFYTDGMEVWNSNHVVTPNGSGLNGDDNATQTALIVPFPDDSSRYYIFTVQDRMSGGDIYYSVFNTGLDGGTGDIETVGKNTFLVENMTEKLVCLQSDCNNEKKLWVVSHERNSNKIFAFPVTSAGVGELVISSAGPIHPYAGENGLTTWTGVLKASPDNSMLAMATLDRSVEWYEFDNTCGTITHIADFPLEAFPDYRGSCYGVCFSPDNTKLYVGESRYKNTWDKDNYLYQYDLSLPTLADIFASKTLLGSPGQEKVAEFMFVSTTAATWPWWSNPTLPVCRARTLNMGNSSGPIIRHLDCPTKCGLPGMATCRAIASDWQSWKCPMFLLQMVMARTTCFFRCATRTPTNTCWWSTTAGEKLYMKHRAPNRAGTGDFRMAIRGPMGSIIGWPATDQPWKMCNTSKTGSYPCSDDRQPTHNETVAKCTHCRSLPAPLQDNRGNGAARFCSGNHRIEMEKALADGADQCRLRIRIASFPGECGSASGQFHIVGKHRAGPFWGLLITQLSDIHLRSHMIPWY